MIVCSDDTYPLAQEYLEKFPEIINILSKRFSYVFIDEMQEMGKYHHDLLKTFLRDGQQGLLMQYLPNKRQKCPLFKMRIIFYGHKEVR